MGWAAPLDLPHSQVYGKERELLDLVRDSLSDDRRVFAYCQYTGVKDVTERLQSLLLDEGIRAEILRASVPPEKREGWLRDKVAASAEVVIGNPRLVQTGLDLYDFPTLAFYQTGYWALAAATIALSTGRLPPEVRVAVPRSGAPAPRGQGGN